MNEKIEPKEKLIFVVDDEPVFLKSCVDFLAKEGFRTDFANDGAEALKKIASLRPDLIILDLLLPKLSGYEVVKKLQEDYTTKTIPVIIITIKKVDPGTRQMFGMEPNVIDFFNKPVNLYVLTLKIHQLLHTIPRDEKLLEEYRKRTAEEKNQ